VKVEVVNPPESTGAGVVGSTEKVKVGAWMTWLTVFDVLPALFASPEYTAVIESVPTGRAFVMMAADDCVPFSAVRVTGLPKITPPFSNDTVPVGTCVPVVVTLAVKVTCTPSPAGFKLEVSAVVVASPLITWISTDDVLPALLESPPYTAVIESEPAGSEEVVSVAT
jgi:hypothetical protein